MEAETRIDDTLKVAVSVDEDGGETVVYINNGVIVLHILQWRRLVEVCEGLVKFAQGHTQYVKPTG